MRVREGRSIIDEVKSRVTLDRSSLEYSLSEETPDLDDESKGLLSTLVKVDFDDFDASDSKRLYDQINEVQNHIKNQTPGCSQLEIADGSSGTKIIRFYNRPLHLDRRIILLQALDMYRGLVFLFTQDANANNDKFKESLANCGVALEALSFSLNQKDDSSFDGVIKAFNSELVNAANSFSEQHSDIKTKKVKPEKILLFARDLAMLHHGGPEEIIVTRTALKTAGKATGKYLWQISESRNPDPESLAIDNTPPLWVEAIKEKYGAWAVKALGETLPKRSPQTSFRILPNPANSASNIIFMEKNNTIQPLLKDARSATPAPKEISVLEERARLAQSNVAQVISEKAFKEGAHQFMEIFGVLLQEQEASIKLPWIYQSLLSPSLSDKTGLVDPEDVLLEGKHSAIKKHKATCDNYTHKIGNITFTTTLFDTNHPLTRLTTANQQAYHFEDHAFISSAVHNVLNTLFLSINNAKIQRDWRQLAKIVQSNDEYSIRFIPEAISNLGNDLQKMAEEEKDDQKKHAYFMLAVLSQAYTNYSLLGNKKLGNNPGEKSHNQAMLAAYERLFGMIGIDTEGGCKSSADRYAEVITLAEALMIQAENDKSWSLCSPNDFRSPTHTNLIEIQVNLLRQGHHQHVLGRNGIPPTRNPGESNADLAKKALGDKKEENKFSAMRKKGTLAYKEGFINYESNEAVKHAKEMVIHELARYLEKQLESLKENQNNMEKEKSSTEKRRSQILPIFNKFTHSNTAERNNRIQYKISLLTQCRDAVSEAETLLEIKSALQLLKTANKNDDKVETINAEGKSVLVQMKKSDDLEKMLDRCYAGIDKISAPKKYSIH